MKEMDLDCSSFLDGFDLPELNELLREPTGACLPACPAPGLWHSPAGRALTLVLSTGGRRQGMFGGGCPDWSDCPPGCGCEAPPALAPTRAALRRPAADPASSQDSAHAPLEVPQDTSSSQQAGSQALPAQPRPQPFQPGDRSSPETIQIQEGLPDQRSRESARRSHKRKAAASDAVERRCQELQSQNTQLTGVWPHGSAYCCAHMSGFMLTLTLSETDT